MKNISDEDYAETDIALTGLLILFIVAFSFVATAVGYYAPPESGEIAVIFPPWFSEVSAIEAVISAGGYIVGPGRFDNIVVAFATDPDFSTRISDHGAWFLASARGLCALAEEFVI